MMDPDIGRDPSEALARDISTRRTFEQREALRVDLDSLPGAAEAERNVADPFSAFTLVAVHLTGPLRGRPRLELSEHRSHLHHRSPGRSRHIDLAVGGGQLHASALERFEH